LIDRKKLGNRLQILDLVRVVAALSVVLYHYLYRGWMSDGLSDVDFNQYDGFFKYGYLGVQLFFMISGFLVTMSSDGRSWQGFVIGRVARLYPAYWVCLLVTMLFIYSIDDGRFYVSGLDALANLTMISKLFGVVFVDGAYWTLIYELVFYFWVFILLLTTVCSLLTLIGFMLFLSCIAFLFNYSGVFSIIYGGEFICYFAAGVCFYEMYKGNRSPVLIAVLLFSIGLTVMQVTGQAMMKNTNIGSSLNIGVSLLIVSVFYAFFLLLAFGLFDNFRFRYAAVLGGVSYPCYLLHQNIGYIVFNKYNGVVGDFTLLAAVLFVLLGLSYFIFKFIEPPIAQFIFKIGRKILK